MMQFVCEIRNCFKYLIIYRYLILRLRDYVVLTKGLLKLI